MDPNAPAQKDKKRNENMPKGYVQCHLCVLKDLCAFATPDSSYQYNHSEPTDDLPHEVFKKLEVATTNCPIRKALHYFGFL
jgi:hypothetical protein